MKHLIVILLILITGATSTSAQKKDTTITLKDTCITLTDIQNTLKYLEDKVTFKEYQQAQQFYIILYNQTIQRKKKK